MNTLRGLKVNTFRSLKVKSLRGLKVNTLSSLKLFIFRGLKVKTLRITLYRAILYNLF